MTYIHTFRCDKGDKYNMVIVPEQKKKFSLKILNIYIEIIETMAKHMGQQMGQRVWIYMLIIVANDQELLFPV